MANLGKRHWEEMKHILQYLKGTTCKCLHFGNDELSNNEYSKSNYVGCVDTRKSMSSYVFLFVGATLSWRSCLQGCTLSSTIEANYVAVFSANKEIVWLSHLVGDPGIHQVPVLHCDNESVIALAKHPVFCLKSKHIEVRFHVIWNILASKHIDIVKVLMDDNPVDALMTSLSSKWFLHCIELMGVG